MKQKIFQKNKLYEMSILKVVENLKDIFLKFTKT